MFNTIIAVMVDTDEQRTLCEDICFSVVSVVSVAFLYTLYFFI